MNCGDVSVADLSVNLPFRSHERRVGMRSIWTDHRRDGFGGTDLSGVYHGQRGGRVVEGTYADRSCVGQH